MFLAIPILVEVILLKSTLVSSYNFVPKFETFCADFKPCREDCSCSSPKCTLLSMNNDARYGILNHHNKIRNLQTRNLPQPSGLTLLQYDLDLEQVSACWASKCVESFTNCFRTPNFPKVSQTVGQIRIQEDDSSKTEYWTRVMNSWLINLEEFLLDMPYSNPSNLTEHNLGQILSDRILFVGCSWALSNNTVFLVCSYGPRGPLPGEDIYMVGDVCTTCPDGYDCQDAEPFESLCRPILYKDFKREKTFEKYELGNQERRDYRNFSRAVKKGEDESEDKKKEMKEKKKGSMKPLAVGIGIFVSLFFFFSIFAAYVYIESKITPHYEM